MKLFTSILLAFTISFSCVSSVTAQPQHRYEYRYEKRDNSAFVKGVVGGFIIGTIISEEKNKQEPRYRYDRDYRYERRIYDYYQERCWLTPYYDNYGRKVFVQECYPGR